MGARVEGWRTEVLHPQWSRSDMSAFSVKEEDGAK